ncbi:MAG TPA: SRPBCC family protein [Bryobacteraceae bacterium]
MRWILIIVAVLILFVAAIAIAGMTLPKAHVASRSSPFKQPPQAIWEAITGPPNWRSDVRGFENLPPRNGHRAWSETDKRGQTIVYESIEEIAQTRLVTRIATEKLPFGGTWTHEIKPVADGCELTITEAGEIYNPLFRFMARFVFGYSGSIEAYLKSLHKKFGEAAD